MSVITTIKTDCKDCYKCVRSCSMKAIQITKGQASIVEERCINDGNCINACPQGAKQVRKTDLEQVRQWLKKKERIAVSLAPSYPAGLNFAKHCEIIRILRALGFVYIQETALAAEYVTKRYLELLDSDFPKPLITSCCPVIIDLVEKHYSHLLPYLAPVLSPMALHGKMLKEKFEKVVFIGPCIAKKEEMEHVDGYIDAVLTFSELE
ncbi:MAG: 4Fe-4S binding protein, partial [Desulfobacterales bacterium]|nr:4Fe-4S binding protein [Desulfobacterales bacterium]